jgi:hypothetical protein
MIAGVGGEGGGEAVGLQRQVGLAGEDAQIFRQPMLDEALDFSGGMAGAQLRGFRR